MTKYLLVAAGGALGATSRFVIATLTLKLYGGLFPLGTFVINVSGSFLIGALMTLFVSRPGIPANWRLFLVTGILGGYTTFSSFEWETVSLTKEGAVVTALLYVMLSLLLGYAGAWLGSLLGQKLWP